MKALLVERSAPRFATARMASAWRAGGGAHHGALRLAHTDPPSPPGPGWSRVRPLLAGICGSDLATVDARSSRWFEPLVSFPFVPGHEVVGVDDQGRRVVVQPVLGCEARGVEPLCPACASGASNRCRNLVAGHLRPGLQTGYCADTGGGWSAELVAHDSQLHLVPEGWTDEAAVMVEPMACAVHGALSVPAGARSVAVVGAGTLGLGVVAALSRLRPELSEVIAAGRYPHQRRLASGLGASTVVSPEDLSRAARCSTASWLLGNGQLTGGVDAVVDCVGSAASLAGALAVVAPGGTLVLVGMPGQVQVDLTPLWQREVHLVGAYAYAGEAAVGGRHSFELAMELVEAARLDRLVSAAYPLERFADAIDHAAAAGRRGAVKIVFDLRRPDRHPGRND